MSGVAGFHDFHLLLQVGVGLLSAAGIMIKVPMLTQVFHVLGLGYESHLSPAPSCSREYVLSDQTKSQIDIL